MDSLEMIIGKIDENLEARIELQVMSGDRTQAVEFLVDTGFNGYLALPMSLVSGLELSLGEVQRGITADGRIGFFDTVRVQIVWHEEPLSLHAQVLDEPLIGARLLHGHELNAMWIPNGIVRLIKPP